MKRIIFLLAVFCVSAHSQPSPVKMHNLSGWCNSEMGGTRWFGLCLCTSSEGAGESSYIMAKLLEEQEWKC